MLSLQMATQAQINANRLNAKHSTGPRSVEGKSVSRFNALKLGFNAQPLVVPGESAADLKALHAGYHGQFHPANPVEAFLVNSLVRCDWTKRRLAFLEANAMKAMLTMDLCDRPNPLGAAVILDAQGANVLEKIFRRQAATDGAYLRALTELRELQAGPQPPEHNQTAASGPHSAAKAGAQAPSHLNPVSPASAAPTLILIDAKTGDRSRRLLERVG